MWFVTVPSSQVAIPESCGGFQSGSKVLPAFTTKLVPPKSNSIGARATLPCSDAIRTAVAVAPASYDGVGVDGLTVNEEEVGVDNSAPPGVGSSWLGATVGTAVP